MSKSVITTEIQPAREIERRDNIVGASRLSIALEDPTALEWILDSFLDHATPDQMFALIAAAASLATAAQLDAMSERADEQREILRGYLAAVEQGAA